MASKTKIKPAKGKTKAKPAGKKLAAKKAAPPASTARLTVAGRVEMVRSAVAEASDGLDDSEYKELFEELISDADGWRDDLNNREAESEDDKDETKSDSSESAEEGEASSSEEAANSD